MPKPVASFGISSFLFLCKINSKRKDKDSKEKTKDTKRREGKIDNRKLLHPTDKHLTSSKNAAEEEEETMTTSTYVNKNVEMKVKYCWILVKEEDKVDQNNDKGEENHVRKI